MDNDPMEKFNFFEDLRFIDGKKKEKTRIKLIANRLQLFVIHHSLCAQYG